MVPAVVTILDVFNDLCRDRVTTWTGGNYSTGGTFEQDFQVQYLQAVLSAYKDAFRSEAIAIRLETMASRLEAVAIRNKENRKGRKVYRVYSLMAIQSLSIPQ